MLLCVSKLAVAGINVSELTSCPLTDAMLDDDPGWGIAITDGGDCNVVQMSGDPPCWAGPGAS